MLFYVCYFEKPYEITNTLPNKSYTKNSISSRLPKNHDSPSNKDTKYHPFANSFQLWIIDSQRHVQNLITCYLISVTLEINIHCLFESSYSTEKYTLFPLTKSLQSITAEFLLICQTILFITHLMVKPARTKLNW